MKTRPARILLVEMNEDGTVGGSHQAQYDLVRYLDRSRFEPVALFYQDNRFADEMRSLGVEVHLWERIRRHEFEVRVHRGRVERITDILFGATVRRFRFLREEGIELLHLNNSPASGADDWLPAARLAGIPCVTFAMGNAPGGLGPLRRWLSRRFDRILVISDHVKRTFLDAGYAPSLLVLTQIGVDIDGFRGGVVANRILVRRALGIPENRVVACMVGNIREWKGQHVVLEALEDMDPDIRDRLLVLFVGAVGTSYRAYSESLHAFVRCRNLEQCTRFIGGRTDVPDLLNASDIGLHASVLPEPFGLVVVEAMAMGLPVVATSIGAPGEVVDQASGRTFDPSDPATLARVLEELVTHTDLRETLGHGARGRSLRFDAKHMVSAVQAVYLELLGDPAL